MAVDIGPKIGIDGEAQFRETLKNLTEQVKSYGAEMKAVATQTDSMTSAEEKAQAKSSLLEQSIAAQKEKVAMLAQALKESADKYGEHDTKTEKWRQALANAETELNGMEKELGEQEGALDESTDAVKENEEATKKADSAWAGFGNTLKVAGATIAAATVATVKAALDLGKAVVSAYADTQQLEGGVETLFKDSADKVMENADRAYKTVGLSANEYMETVTGMAASLISSMGGDTAAAAEKADLALRDMSDNANKMGSDMESIKNAYSGFAKGQYTMLDNLKLGYGGTKTEMERLLKDAEAISGVKYDLDSYADIVDAIHVVQTEMDITGTTAKEAESTISGSLGMLKSSYDNLIAGLGDPGANMKELARNVTGSLKSVVENIMPVVENISAALPEAFGALLESVSGMLPIMLQTATGLLTEVLNAIVSAIPELIPVVVLCIETVVGALMENLPAIIEAGIELLQALIEGIMGMLPSLLDAALELLQTLAEYLIREAPILIENGLDFVQKLIDGIMRNLPTIVNTVIELVLKLAKTIFEHLPEILQKGVEIVDSLTKGLIQNLPAIIQGMTTLITELIKYIVNNLPEILKQGVAIVTSLVSGLIQAVPELLIGVGTLIVDIVKTFKDYDWLSIGRNIIEGIKQGLENAWETLKSAVTGICDRVGSAFKDFFGIESPSKWMRDEIGGNLIKGLDAGFDKYKGMAIDAAEGVSKEIGDAFQTDFGLLGNAGRSSMSMTLTTPVYLDGRVIATVVNETLGAAL